MTTVQSSPPLWKHLLDIRLFFALAALALVWWLEQRWNPDMAVWRPLPGHSDNIIFTYTATALLGPGALLLVAAVSFARSLEGRNNVDVVCYLACLPVLLVTALMTANHASMRLELTPEQANVRLHLVYQRGVARDDAALLIAKPYRVRGATGDYPVLQRHDGSRVHLQEWAFAAELACLWQLPMDEEARIIVSRCIKCPALDTPPGT